MKKIITILGISIGFLLILFLTLRISWSFKEKKILNIYILDKTVTRMDRPGHKAFTWIINNKRYVLPDKKSYSNTKDYYGFFPVDMENEIFDFKSVRISEVDAYATAYDMAYYADCYGVYSFEWYKGKSKPIRTQKVYGGLNQNDYLLMKKMLDNGKLLLAEYNMFSTPTNALVRSKTEELLNLKWSGWTGKYYPTFDVSSNNGPPVWMKNLFESQHMGVWPASESGIVLINNDGLIEILVDGKHLNSSIPIIRSNAESKERFNITKDVYFEKWFEFIDPQQNAVHSQFEIDVTTAGDETLNRLGLSNVFPAVIEGTGNEKFFYFCGDFAVNPAQMWTAKLAGAKWINHFLYRFNAPNKATFFKSYYRPLINNILDEYYQTLDR